MSKLSNLEGDLSKWDRAVLAKRASIIGAVTVIVNLAISFGWVTPEVSAEVARWLGAAFDAVAVVGTIVAVQGAVTPVSDPKDNDGNTLVPASSVVADTHGAVDAAKQAYADALKGQVAQAADAAVNAAKAAEGVAQAIKTDAEAVAKPVIDAAGNEVKPEN